MRFFDTNYLYKNFGGSFAASSAVGLAPLAFDEENSFSWYSQGENTNGNAIYLERILATSATINRIFVKNTNISNLTIEVDIGAGYVALSSASAFTLTKSAAGDCYFYQLTTSIAVSKIKFIGSNTIVANEEKTIMQCLGFMELGRIKNYSDIQPKRERIQSVAKLNIGKVDIINKGRTTSFKVKLKSHYNAADNAIIDLILQRNREMWIWINDINETPMVMIQEPYRFEDIYKVAFQKADSLHFTKNMFFSGVDVDFDLVEVA